MSWLVIFGTIIIIHPVAIFMKKRLSMLRLYSTVVFGLFVQTLVDTFASFQYHAWGFFEPDKAEFKALWIIIGIYPIFAAILVNWFPFYGAWWKKVCYLIAWSAFSTLYEWLCLKVGIMWHRNWNLYYSFLLYPFIYFLLIIHLRWTKTLTGNDHSTRS